ncbi:peptide chain release factor N(5)-glutamine methyltransferase [Marinicrinis lubricantis]|uniref:Release factor glutamine methyltransferase n=1 Tax=Marinicrinis lubricantis TaxID=2086470 RepID=A0ABW1IKH3_9BACL
MEKPLTIREAYLQASSFLSTTRNTQDVQHVCRLLLEHVLEMDRSELLLSWQEPFPMERMEALQQALQRKAEGVPVQYITGEQEFFGFTFRVSPAVLIPRPETELLVERVQYWGRRLSDRLGKHSLKTADIGTGSGIIPITLALLEPDWQFYAVDLSPDALGMASQNAELHHVRDKLEFIEGDLLQPLLERQVDIDILISNPPYIPSTDVLELQPEVKDYEPLLALDGGADGLRCYRELIEGAGQLGRPPHIIGFETGAGQAADVADMLRAAGNWDRVEIVKDLAEIERHVIGLGNEWAL